jgi:hypothetical protein
MPAKLASRLDRRFCRLSGGPKRLYLHYQDAESGGRLNDYAPLFRFII